MGMQVKSVVILVIVTAIILLTSACDRTISEEKAIQIASEGVEVSVVERKSLITTKEVTDLSDLQITIGRQELPENIWFITFFNPDGTVLIPTYLDAKTGEILSRKFIDRDTGEEIKVGTGHNNETK